MFPRLRELNWFPFCSHRSDVIIFGRLIEVVAGLGSSLIGYRKSQCKGYNVGEKSILLGLGAGGIGWVVVRGGGAGVKLMESHKDDE